MSLELGALLFEGVKKIVFTAISKRVVLAGENFLTRRKIESRIDNSIAQVVEQLMPFFENEHLSDHKRQVLISNYTHELSEILEDPKEVFAASLEGQKIFDRRYEEGRLPQGIRDEGLEDLYALVFPQIANLICAFPPAIEQWKIEGYRDGFRRLDEIAATLGGVANKLDQLTSKDSEIADVLLNRVRQSLTQRVEFQLDLTGLRGDRPDAVPLEKCFVVPGLVRTLRDRQFIETEKLRVASEVLGAFSGPSIRAVVMGAPGAGKSTWSRWLQREQLTSQGGRLTVLVRLRDLMKVPTLPSYQQLIREAAGTHLREEVDPGVAHRWCQSGIVTFILDGFDEVPPNQRDSVIAWISELDGITEHAGLILTSRPLTTNHLEQLSSKWFRWELLPFDQPRITDYISKWYAYAPVLTDKPREIDAEKLSLKWVKDFALQPLVGTPLMLATIVMVHHMDGELPRGRARLYERYIDGMLGLWDSRWGIPSAIELSLDLKRLILTRVAVHLHMENIDQLGDEEIEVLMQRVLPSVGCTNTPQEVLDHLRERTGLLIGPGTWSFVHKNVGEFLVAAAIRDGDCVAGDGQKLDRLRLFAERQNDRWNNVLFFWTGLTTPGDLMSFIEQVSAESSPLDTILALSLIYDQIQSYRLTEPWKSETLLALLQRDFRSKEDILFFGLVCGPLPKKTDWKGPTALMITVRTPEGVFLYSALWECLRLSRISWKKASICHPSILFHVWTFFTAQAPNTEDLRAALDRSTWVKGMHPTWLMFPATLGIRHTATGSGGLCLAEFIEVLGQADSELKQRIPFFLLGALITLAQDTRFSTETVATILHSLESVKDYELDQQWLRLSTEFVDYERSSRPEFDLLERSLKTLHRIDLGNSLDPNLASTVRSYIKELISKRNRILSEHI